VDEEQQEEELFPDTSSVASAPHCPPSGKPSRHVGEHEIVPDASSVARALYRPAIGRLLPRLEFDCEATAAATRTWMIVPSASPESTGPCTAALTATVLATVRPRNAPRS
jgi:hypothetical protein